jgi:hypothetical protein
MVKVETILRNHKQSGHHSSGEERLQEIKNNFLNPKSKNIDYSYFYAFLMLEDKDLKFASWQLEEGIGTSAGFGTVGGGVTAVKKKLNVQEVVALDIQSLTKKLPNLRMEFMRIRNEQLQGFFHHPLHLAMLVMQLIPAGSLKVQLSVIPKLQQRRKR